MTMLYTKEQVQQSEMETMMEKTFEGSLPAFVAAFCSTKKMSKDEIAELEQMIHEYCGE